MPRLKPVLTIRAGDLAARPVPLEHLPSRKTLSFSDLIGLLALSFTLGFCFGYFLAFMR